MKAKVLWFTGLSGSGKSTIANCISKKLIEFNYSVITLDGDEIRNSVHVHLGFSPVDILENNKKIAIICKDLLQNHDFILVPIISPFRKTRLNAKKIIGKSFVEVYIKSSLKTVINRDVKGLYKKALNGKIENLLVLTPWFPTNHPINQT